MDSIIIRELEVYAGHGWYKEETDCGQKFLVNAVLNTNLRSAGLSDDLSCSTDYGKVCHFISDYLRQHTFLLIEAAAEHLAHEILIAFPMIMELTLEIRKPFAPVGLPLAYASVLIRRGWKK
ncbi:MAG: dihydroneopterin aldolase, partial [Lachnospiraceae bacterium]|nr:dihydroneopterin aldolase [Lachnospiraceae bacterium]